MLAAQFKAGKTTIVANLERSLVDGDQFLGAHDVTTVDGTVVTIDLEMSTHQVDDWHADQKIRNDDRVIVIPLRGSAAAFDIVDPAIRKQWADMLKARSCGYLIVDCLRPVLDALGLNEHTEAGRFLTSLDALLTEAEIPDAAVIHHMCHIAERSRGDSRIRDWPDVEWRLVRERDEPGSARYISAYDRDVDIEESLLTYDRMTRRLAIGGGSRKDAAAWGAHRRGQTTGRRRRTVRQQDRDCADGNHRPRQQGDQGSAQARCPRGANRVRQDQERQVVLQGDDRNSMTSPARHTSPPVSRRTQPPPRQLATSYREWRAGRRGEAMSTEVPVRRPDLNCLRCGWRTDQLGHEINCGGRR